MFDVPPKRKKPTETKPKLTGELIARLFKAPDKRAGDNQTAPG
jgi:hypothetical protein